jgi:TPR repeat protein
MAYSKFGQTDDADSIPASGSDIHRHNVSSGRWRILGPGTAESNLTVGSDGNEVSKPCKFEFRQLKIAVIASLIALSVLATAPQGLAGDGRQAFNRGDYGAALMVWLPYAEKGSARAQYNISIMYEKGLGVEKDDEIAVEWLNRAAKSGNLIAQQRLAQMYDTGDKVTKDLAVAHKWYLSGAEQGHVASQKRLGFMYASGLGVTPSMAQSYKWFSIAAQSGDAGAKRDLALIAPEMTAHQIGQGEQLAFAWLRNRRD